MTIKVPYMTPEAIEQDANSLLAEYARARGVIIAPPIPIEDILEKHLKLGIEFDDTHSLFDIARSGTAPDILGAMFFKDERIVIDESLDPEEHPAMEGRYRFTLAHEGGGHWRLHRRYFNYNPEQAGLFEDPVTTSVICRSSQAKEPVEWQAAEGLALWEKINERLSFSQPLDATESERFGEPHLIRPRLGQGAFRVFVTDIYGRRCAVTQERTLPALEAAHIRPYGDGGAHEARNGLLLRRDIHSLFDAGYVTVTPDLRFEVSRRIREEFDNGKHYYALDGHHIAPPADMGQRPNPDALRWHNEHVFKG